MTNASHNASEQRVGDPKLRPRVARAVTTLLLFGVASVACMRPGEPGDTAGSGDSANPDDPSGAGLRAGEANAQSGEVCPYAQNPSLHWYIDGNVGGSSGSGSSSGGAGSSRPAILSFRQRGDDHSIKLATTCDSGGSTLEPGMSKVAMACEAGKSQSDLGYKRVAAIFGLIAGQQYCNSVDEQLCVTFQVTGPSGLLGTVRNVHLRDTFTCSQGQNEDKDKGRFDVDGCTYQAVLGLIANHVKAGSAKSVGGDYLWTDEQKMPDGKTISGAHLQADSVPGYKVGFTLAACRKGD